jgi:hypothetical protein
MLRAVRIRFTAVVAASSLLLFACPREQKPEPSPQDSGLVPITKTATTATTALVTPPPPPPKDVVEPPPAETCPTAPKWTSTPPCVKSGFLYASGDFKSQSATALARSTAASRARKRLAMALGAHANDTFTLKGSEIDQIHHCGGVTYALARVPHSQGGEFKTCSADQLAEAPLKQGCPKWTSRLAWKEGNTLYAVTPALKVMQKFQAEQAAVNRARQTASEMVEVELRLTPDGVTSVAKNAALREKRRSSATCDGARWMLVAFESGSTSDEVTVNPKKKGASDRFRLK